MTSAQSRIAETLEVFYGAADRAAEGAMAGHAYKRSVDDLDTSFTRELVRSASRSLEMNSQTHSSGIALPNHNIGAFG